MLGFDPSYIGVSVDPCNEFNRTIRAGMLGQTFDVRPKQQRLRHRLQET